MKILATTIGVAFLLAVTAFAQQLHHHATASNTNSTTQNSQVQNSQVNDDEEKGTPAVVIGYVRDVACLVQNHKAGAATSKIAQQCLEDCIRGGSPIFCSAKTEFCTRRFLLTLRIRPFAPRCCLTPENM